MNNFALSLLLVCLTYFCDARPENLIVQGYMAQPGQFPWHASIHVNRLNQHKQYCGGSLISPNFILTAARHIDRADSAQIDLGSTQFSRPLVSMMSQTFRIHPQYNAAQNIFDLALIQLPSNVLYSQHIFPIRLPTRSHQSFTYENVNGVVSGFGVTSTSSNFLSEALRFADQTVISIAQCSQAYGQGFIQSQVLCAVGSNNNGRQSACYGDTGGALAVNDNGVWTQIGLVSFYPRQGCDSGLPVGFMKVAAGLDWISSVASVLIWP